jgi:hypothetical protein
MATTMIPAVCATVGMEARMPDGTTFHCLKSVVEGEHDEHFGWQGGWGVKLSVGWGSCVLRTTDLIEVQT